MIEGILTLTRSSRFRSVDFNLGDYLLSAMRIGKAYNGLVAGKGLLRDMSVEDAERLLNDWDKVTQLLIRVTGSNFYTFVGPFRLSNSRIDFRIYVDVFKEVKVRLTPSYIQLTSQDFRRRFRGRVLQSIIKDTADCISKYTGISG
ncbi:MAG: hypothetical protein RXQ73_01815 [Caldivirga sp.]|jgi:hypothetical protein|uniref:hypothetical protein n=1 Tax=Caldivirga sp. MU80 TaxID=1650354 RepID=UPI0007488898|nr:hypothetical protein [Caldivirga sp. MU80]KUO83906.1 MAG: hypothetical protein AT709_05830 [Caldivirga sp. MG_3]KUO89934.1 MAG: hypothetical protein AT712_02585 [Caldivirga sp. CIS_19]NAZ29506.1 hypothetical protein [Caldivirga sp.]